MSIDTATKANSLIHRAETFRLHQEYDLAIRYFDEAISVAKGSKLRFAWAHKGEAHFGCSMTQYNDKESQLENFKQAMLCFNKALAMKDEEVKKRLTGTDKPKLKLEIKPDDLANVFNYPWTLAHRGELLRVLGNEFNSQLNQIWAETSGIERDQIYQEALACFEAATQLERDYAWAYAHWGATLCNSRGDETSYLRAVEVLDKAIRLAQHNYSWCYAYKAVAFVLLSRYENALYELMIAVMQDEKILEHLIYPPGQSALPLSPEAKYMEAMWQYLIAVNKRSPDPKQQAYISYYNAVVASVAPTDAAKDRLVANLISVRAIDQVKEALAHCTSHHDIPADDPDILYMEGGLLALDVKKKSQMKEALSKLKEAIDKAKDKDNIKKRAQLDVAWYIFRNNKDFENLVAV